MMSEKWSGMNESTATSPIDMYKENTKKIDEIFGYRRDLEKTFRGNLENIELAYRMARTHIDTMNSGGQPKVTQHEFDTILKTIDIFTEFYIYSNELSPIYRDLVYHLSVLLNNWNENISKNQEIKRKLTVLDRFTRDAKTMEDTIFILRNLLARLKKYSETEPMAINLSKHYLDALQDVKNSECKEII